jgi:hypothetical protein
VIRDECAKKCESMPLCGVDFTNNARFIHTMYTDFKRILQCEYEISCRFITLPNIYMLDNAGGINRIGTLYTYVHIYVGIQLVNSQQLVLQCRLALQA